MMKLILTVCERADRELFYVSYFDLNLNADLSISYKSLILVIEKAIKFFIAI